MKVLLRLLKFGSICLSLLAASNSSMATDTNGFLTEDQLLKKISYRAGMYTGDLTIQSVNLEQYGNNKQREYIISSYGVGNTECPNDDCRHWVVFDYGNLQRIVFHIKAKSVEPISRYGYYRGFLYLMVHTSEKSKRVRLDGGKRWFYFDGEPVLTKPVKRYLL